MSSLVLLSSTGGVRPEVPLSKTHTIYLLINCFSRFVIGSQITVQYSNTLSTVRKISSFILPLGDAKVRNISVLHTDFKCETNHTHCKPVTVLL